jgi:hypothetical protein
MHQMIDRLLRERDVGIKTRLSLRFWR